MERERQEAETLAAARQGDPQAFGRLVQPLLDQAYRLALRALGHRQEAEDAVQTALYKSWQALPRFRGDARFSTWFYRILWRECSDRLRRPPPRPVDPETARGDGAHDPERRWEDVEQRHLVAQVLERLPPPYRTALTLFYLEEFSVKEMAEILHLPVGTVKTHLYRARAAFKAELLKEQASREGGGARGSSS